MTKSISSWFGIYVYKVIILSLFIAVYFYLPAVDINTKTHEFTFASNENEQYLKSHLMIYICCGFILIVSLISITINDKWRRSIRRSKRKIFDIIQIIFFFLAHPLIFYLINSFLSNTVNTFFYTILVLIPLGFMVIAADDFLLDSLPNRSFTPLVRLFFWFVFYISLISILACFRNTELGNNFYNLVSYFGPQATVFSVSLALLIVFATDSASNNEQEKTNQKNIQHELYEIKKELKTLPSKQDIKHINDKVEKISFEQEKLSGFYSLAETIRKFTKK